MLLTLLLLPVVQTFSPHPLIVQPLLPPTGDDTAIC
jgi:hypothetical protein